METTEKKKKHKGGYELLKEKYAKLEAELSAKDQRIAGLTLNVESEVKKAKQSAEAERDEWKAKYEQKRNSCELYENEATRLHGLIEEADKRIAFLLKHCPFWVRWMYRKQFEKGGN